MSRPAATRQDHERFCRTEGWVPVRDARGRTGTHHVTYELSMKDGRILRTRISHPADRTTYGPGIWSHILRDQLQVSEAEFWSCVRDGARPDRGEHRMTSGSLPAELVHLLINRVGLPERDVAAMSRDDAVARLQRYWLDGA
jgi:hypothetical protein